VSSIEQIWRGEAGKWIMGPSGELLNLGTGMKLGRVGSRLECSTGGRWVMSFAYRSDEEAVAAIGEIGRFVEAKLVAPEVLPSPVVVAIDPVTDVADGVSVVTVTGRNFMPGCAVTLGEELVTTFVGTDTVTAVLPAAQAAGAVDVVVTNPDGGMGALADGFTYGAMAAPTLSGIVPDHGTAGVVTAVVISGTNLLEGGSVSFGTEVVAAYAVNPAGTELTCNAPADLPAGAVDVTYTAPDAQTAALTAGFTYE